MTESDIGRAALNQAISRRRFLASAALGFSGLASARQTGGGAPPPGQDRSRGHRPTEPIALFNGRNLDGLYSWLADSKYQDPRKVFSVRDGMLRISGEEFGYIATEKSYRDYHLIAEFKWGREIFGNPRTVRNSGILMHATGPDALGELVPAVLFFELERQFKERTHQLHTEIEAVRAENESLHSKIEILARRLNRIESQM